MTTPADLDLDLGGDRQPVSTGVPPRDCETPWVNSDPRVAHCQ